MYKVIEYFTDLHDKSHPYHVGDIFPREGIKVTDKRIAALAGSDNKRGIPLIALVEEPEAADASEPAPVKTAKKPARKTVKK